MADGSEWEFERNIEFVAGAGDLARAHGAAVEAELGSITGDEDVARAVEAGALTDPDQAVEFMHRTGADCLAVSIGNIHGTYVVPPELDWERLDAIRAGVSEPLSLHGASGIPDDLVQRSIRSGIAKINVNTELRTAYLAATERTVASVLDGSRLNALHAAQVAAVQDVVAGQAAGIRHRPGGVRMSAIDCPGGDDAGTGADACTGGRASTGWSGISQAGRTPSPGTARSFGPTSRPTSRRRSPPSSSPSARAASPPPSPARPRCSTRPVCGHRGGLSHGGRGQVGAAGRDGPRRQDRRSTSIARTRSRALSAAAVAAGVTLWVHIEIDSGLHRVGLRPR